MQQLYTCWVYVENAVNVVKSYKYLGIGLTSKLSWETFINLKAGRAKMSLNKIWHNF